MPELFTIFILASLVVFAIGIIVGWQSSALDNEFTQSNLQIVVGILVTIMWVASIAAEIIIPTYTVSVLIHGIMGAVVGYLFSDDGLNINIGGGGE